MTAMANAPTHWFVAAGAALGDGSFEKPFHDLWQAARAAGPGDTIHIAAGIYFGRYDRSSWIVDCPRLTILGGYSRDFTRSEFVGCFAHSPYNGVPVFEVRRKYL